MRKVILFNMMTLDGFFEGPGREIDWHNVDAEFNTFAIDQLDAADLLLFGRVTYEMMASYWPTAAAKKSAPVVARGMNDMPKVVFSRKLKKATWANTALAKGELGEEIRKLKKKKGKDLVVMGSGMLVSQLTQLGLVDEFQVVVNPIVLGTGRSMFDGVQRPTGLELLRSRVFGNGNVLLCYAPAK